MNGWCDGTVVGALCPVAPGPAGDAGSSGLDGLAAAMAQAFSQLLQALLGFWSGPDGVGDLAAPGGLVATLGSYTTTIVAAAATLGVIVAGTRLAVTSSRVDQPARDLARGLMILALVAGGGAATVQAVRSVLDDAADGLLTSGFDGAPVSSQLVALVDLQRGGIAPGVTFLLGLLGALSTFAQFFVMVARGPVLAVLVGLLPIAAASTMTGTGIAHLRRLVAWIGALTAYKFVAGLLYAGAFLAVRGTDGAATSAIPTGQDRITGVVAGISLVVVAVGALPALVRLLTPAVAAVAAAGTGPAETATAPSTGAVQLSGRGRQGTATGPPSDAGARTGAGLLRGPSGTGPWRQTGSALPGPPVEPVPASTGPGRPAGPEPASGPSSAPVPARSSAPVSGPAAGTGWPEPPGEGRR